MIKFDVSLFDDLPVLTNNSLSSFGDLHVTICLHLTPPGKKGVLDLRRPKILNYNGITFCNLWLAPVNCNDFVNCSHALFVDRRIFLRDCKYSSPLAGAQRIRTLVCENGAQQIRTLVCEKHQVLLVCEFAHWCAKKKLGSHQLFFLRKSVRAIVFWGTNTWAYARSKPVWGPID